MSNYQGPNTILCQLCLSISQLLWVFYYLIPYNAECTPKKPKLYSYPYNFLFLGHVPCFQHS